MWAILCTILAILPSISAKAALYVDDGFHQTILDSVMSSEEKQELELDILNLLDLRRRPSSMVDKSPLKKSAPRFLMDVYKTLMDEENEENSRAKRSLGLSGEEQQKIDESDVIMTLESVSHHVSGVRHERGKRLWFNTNDVPLSEDIVGAELKIYQTLVKKRNTTADNYTVTVYQLINTDDGERELNYVSAIQTVVGFSGWLGLNMTSCLASWVAFPDSNKGLYLSVHPTNKPGHEVRPEEIGLVTSKGPDEDQPFMVAFLKATNHIKVRRSVRNKSRVRKEAYSSVVKNFKHLNADTLRSCQLHTLYVSFKDLKWQDWIIAPDGYAAYYCAGECNFPLNSHMNATNHAIVQTLVHLILPLRYPKPCCAPNKLNPISVLYFLDDKNVVLKKYKRMAVKSCGCH